LAQIPLANPRRIVDIGCGPGNSTELLVRRWPNADVIGIDTSADMLRQARERLPQQTFMAADVAHWVPPDGTDLLFGNAIFQWVPDHLKQLQRLLGALAPGGVLAVQGPDNFAEPAHVQMGEVAQQGSWRDRFPGLAWFSGAKPRPGEYYDALAPLCTRFEIWQTIFNHVLDGIAAVVEWGEGAGLRLLLDRLDDSER